MTIAASLLASTLLLTACGDSDPAQRVVPADEQVAGNSLAELVTQWATNLHEVPLADHFLTDPSKCDMGRSTDDVFFAPTWTGGETTATCTVRKGQAVLLVPVALVFVDDGTDLVVSDLEDGWNLSSATLTLNGEAIELAQRQVDTPIVKANLPEGNIWDLPAGETDTMARAQAAVVENLPVGTHEVVLAGEFGDNEFAGTMKLTLVVEE